MRRILGAATLIGVCSAANAETLSVSGYYEAQAELDGRVHTIVVESFGGDAGTDLSFLVTDALANIEVDGQRWYSVIPASLAELNPALGFEGSGEDGSQIAFAVMQGTARTHINDYKTDPKEVKECTKKIDGDRVKKETVSYECRVLDVGYQPSIRLTSSDGSIIYQESQYLDADQTYCADEDEAPDAFEMLDSLAKEFSNSVRFDLAPHHRAEQLRILERRKGLSKEDSRAFKWAVKLTETDALTACDAFKGFEASYQNHVSVLFNIGLCHESAGDITYAHDYYSRALAVDPGKYQVRAGLRRVVSRLNANRLISEHYSGT